jgi:hypothetical protein
MIIYFVFQKLDKIIIKFLIKIYNLKILNKIIFYNYKTFKIY